MPDRGSQRRPTVLREVWEVLLTPVYLVWFVVGLPVILTVLLCSRVSQHVASARLRRRTAREGRRLNWPGATELARSHTVTIIMQDQSIGFHDVDVWLVPGTLRHAPGTPEIPPDGVHPPDGDEDAWVAYLDQQGVIWQWVAERVCILADAKLLASVNSHRHREHAEAEVQRLRAACPGNVDVITVMMAGRRRA